MTNSDLITSKEILKATGISRATLNNYIKLGILPKPIVSSPGPEQQGTKQIGYFPRKTLDDIEKVRQLKRQGNTMQQIAAMFQDNTAAPPAKPRVPSPSSRKKQPPRAVAATSILKDETSGLKLTIDRIDAPAYLIGNNFEIEWINNQAEQLFFDAKISELIDIEERNIFKLLLAQKLHHHLHNWQEVLGLHFTVLQRDINSSEIHRLYKGSSPEEIGLLTSLFESRQEPALNNLYRLPITITIAPTVMKSFLLHTMAFREGTFFIFVPTDNITSDLLTMLSHREQIINELLQNRMPSLVSLCSLVADFQDSAKIRAELLPVEFFEMFNSLWQKVGPVFEKYNGIYGNHPGDGMLFYFVNNHSAEYLSDSIKCAIELREVMSKFSDEWKRRKGWDNELYLNIGINEGQEFLGTIQSAGNIAFTAMGESVNIANQLSQFANNGEIMATKNLISKLPSQEDFNFQYGIHQKAKNMVVNNSFARLGDIDPSGSHDFLHLQAISNLPVTSII